MKVGSRAKLFRGKNAVNERCCDFHLTLKDKSINDRQQKGKKISERRCVKAMDTTELHLKRLNKDLILIFQILIYTITS